MNKQALIDKINEIDLSIQFDNLEEKEEIINFFKRENFDCIDLEEIEEGFIERYDNSYVISDYDTSSSDVMTFTEFLEVIETRS